jgi:Uma2 family endonuclease
MHMAIAAREWTVEEVWELPEDGNRYEVVDGELLVTPSPRSLHQDAVLELFALLRAYLKQVPVGRAYASPADIRYGPRTMVQPDVFVAPFVEGRRPQGWNEMRHLILAAEVLSPSSARSDRTIKRRLYQREGVPEYWIVDVDARVIERWTPTDERPEVLTGVLRWQPDPAHAAFELDLERYFAEVIGEG